MVSDFAQEIVDSRWVCQRAINGFDSWIRSRRLRKIAETALFGLLTFTSLAVPARPQTKSAASVETTKMQIPARFRTAERSLITQFIDHIRTAPTQGAVHSDVAVSKDLGSVEDSLSMDHLQLILRRPQERQAAFDAFVDALQRPGTDVYHHWLSPDEIGNEFGPSASDRDSVSVYLRSEGFTVNHVSKSGMFIDFSGTAKQVQNSFHTEIHFVMTPDGRRRYSAVKVASLPEALAPVIVGFASMSNIEPQPSLRSRVAQDHPGRGRPDYTTTCSSGTCYDVGPQDFYTIYNELPLISTGTNTGAGITIALLEQSDINPSDVTHFRTTFNVVPNAPALTIWDRSGFTACTDPELTSDEHEAVLDAEWAGTVAPGATLLFVSCRSGSTPGAIIAAEAVVDNNLASILSLSYIQAESSGSSTITTVFNLWEQAAAQGQTVVVCAGDTGSATNIANQHTVIAANGVTVNGYASTPYNVAAGGTDFQDTYNQIEGDSSYGPAHYWNPSNAAGGSSALSYIPETTWNDSCAGSLLATSKGFSSSAFCDAFPTTYQNGGGSGGVSILYPRPSWQNGTVFGLPPANGIYNYRLVPDISLFAASGTFSEHSLIYYQSDTGHSLEFGGGTSFVAPQVAGIFALIQQKVGSLLGQPDSVLYSLAGTAYGTSTFSGGGCNGSGTLSNSGTSSSTPGANCIFYDILTGNNSQECAAGSSSSCYSDGGPYGILSTSSTTAQPAYAAGEGYDLATGIGSANIINLVNSWPNPTFNLTVTPSSLNITAGQSGTAVVAVAPVNGFSSLVTLSCSGLPSEASCSFSPASVMPRGATPTTTLSITTTASGAALAIPLESSRRSTYAFLFPGLVMALCMKVCRNRGSRGCRLLSLMLVLAVASTLSGCMHHHPTPGSPAGSYTVTVSAASGGAGAVNQSAVLTVTITN